MGMGNIANTGMQAAMTNMDTISNNIANANTPGFKKSRANFSDLFPSGNDASNVQTGLGVAVSSIQQDFSPGGPGASTGRKSDMCINGNGFFILKDSTSGQLGYSRNGRFAFDRETGYFTNGTQRLQGFPAVSGVIPAGSAPIDLQVSTATVPAQATATVTQQKLNLYAGSQPPTTTPFNPANLSTYNYTTGTKIFDSLGTEHDLALYYVNVSPGNWTVNAYVDQNSIGTGTLTFDTGGQLSSSTGLNALSFAPGTGATSPQVIAVDLSGATQFGNPNNTSPFTKDGYPAGNFSDYSIDTDGFVRAIYTNGQKPTLVGQVAIATFQAPENLRPLGNSSWSETTDSGAPIINQSNSSNNISPGTLELSNVGLAEEMVSLITAQNTFQANAQVEQTFSQVMQTVVKL